MNSRAFLKFLLNVIIPVTVVYFILRIFKPAASVPLLVIFLLFIFFKNRTGIFTFLGSLNYNKGNLSKARRYFHLAYKNGASSPSTVMSYGYILLKSGDVDESEKLLNQVLKLNPDEKYEILAKANLALISWKKGNLDGAIETLQELVQGTKNTTIYGSLGYLLILKGDLEKAFEINVEAYEYNNTNSIIVDNLGYTYYLKGDYEKAYEIYSKLMALNPSYPEAYYNYGLVLNAINQRGRALNMMEKALKFTPTFLSAVKPDDIRAKMEEIRNSPEPEIKETTCT